MEEKSNEVSGEERDLNEIMLDLETMDTGPYSAILSIGAVRFNLETGKMGGTFYRNIYLKSCTDLGMTLSADTIMWWMKQSDEARKAFNTSANNSLRDVCEDFTMYVNNVKATSLKKVSLWGNGASFDNVIIRNAYDKLSYRFPLPFYADCDVRTIMKIAPKIEKKDSDRKGVYHNALDDAIYQVSYLSAAYNRTIGSTNGSEIQA